MYAEIVRTSLDGAFVAHRWCTSAAKLLLHLREKWLLWQSVVIEFPNNSAPSQGSLSEDVIQTEQARPLKHCLVAYVLPESDLEDEPQVPQQIDADHVRI